MNTDTEETPIPAPPKELGTAGKALWREYAGNPRRPDDRWVILEPGELVILRKACILEDLAERLRVELIDADSMVRGSNGNMVVNPMISELRQLTSTQRQLLSSLVPPPETHSGRFDSASGRKAAIARHWGPK